MRNLVKVGKIVSTHGIKGEIKIISNFPYKSRVFIVGNNIYIDNKIYEIKTYRHHKNYEMLTLNDYTNINEVLFLMQKDVYFEKEKLNLNTNEVLDEDLITYKVLTNNKKVGIIKEIFQASPKNKIIRVLIDNEEILIPFYSPQIVNIDKEKKELTIKINEK